MNALASDVPYIKPLYLFKSLPITVGNLRRNPPAKPRYGNLEEVDTNDYIVSLVHYSIEKGLEEIGLEATTIEDCSLEILDKIKNETDLNPNIKAMSSRAYQSAKNWLKLCFRIKKNANSPHIILTGDGGVAIEWREESNYISIHFDESDSDMDMIYYRFNGDRNYKDLTESNLTELFTQLP